MLHERLRRLRLLKGMSQAQLARALGVSPSTIGMYEQGRREPDHNMLIRIAKLFDTTVDFLLGAPSRRDKSFEELLGEFKRSLMQQEGLMVNGVLLEDGDVELIVDAIRQGAQLAVSRKQPEKGEKKKTPAGSRRKKEGR